MKKLIEKIRRFITKDPLPDKPSELIILALKDLERCENCPLYEIDMGAWHAPGGLGYKMCYVCAAGAVMALTLKTPNTVRKYPVEFSPTVRGKLRAINCLRMGAVHEALDILRMDHENTPKTYYIPSYESARPSFYSTLRDLANHLRAFGK